MLAVWDLKWSCWQFSLTIGHSGVGKFCSEPQHWAWRLWVLPYAEPHWCQQQMCWTTRLKPWTPCLGRGCVHWLLAGVVHSEQKKRFCVKVFLCFHGFSPVCLSVQCQIENIFLSLCFCNTSTPVHTSLNIHGEHPRLQWVTPGYANSLSPLSLYSLVPTPAASGTYWQQSHTEP